MTSRKVMLSAVQPTNRLTIGNYLGAIRHWVKGQSTYQCYFFAVDLHSLTSKHDPVQLRENTYLAVATYLAAGIDPQESVVFIQSHVAEHSQLAWILSCHSYMGELNRMTQYKDKSSRAGATIPVGLFTYPILMAADILLYNTDVVPVGEDQKQHIELARDIAGRMNGVHGPLFRIPEPLIAKVGARIMDLQDPLMKMSKSVSTENGAIYLLDSEKEIEKKIKRAVTDSGSEIVYSDDKPGVRNLLHIQAAITHQPPEKIAESYQGKQYGHLKVDTAQIVIEELRPIQKKVQEFLQDRSYLDKVLKEGADKARSVAAATVARVHQAMGFLS